MLLLEHNNNKITALNALIADVEGTGSVTATADDNGDNILGGTVSLTTADSNDNITVDVGTVDPNGTNLTELRKLANQAELKDKFLLLLSC